MVKEVRKITELPLVLGEGQSLISSRETPASRPRLATSKISIILPIYNEGSILERNVTKMKKSLDQFGSNYEILLCDDNSNDGTEESVRTLLSDSVFYLRFSRRLGKGGTIKNALRLCTGDAIAILDADIPVPHHELFSAIGLVVSGRQLVVGVRRDRRHSPMFRKVLSLGFNKLMNLAFQTGIKDHQCGFKVIDRAVARTLLPMIRSDHFMFDAELIVNANSLKVPVDVVEVDWAEQRPRGDSRISPLRISLTMLIDLALLRIGILGSTRLLRLTQMKAGSFTELKTGRKLAAQMTIIDTNYHRVLYMLRKLYLSTVFSA